MIDLDFKVDRQKLSSVDTDEEVVRGTKNMLRFNFDFSEDWNGMQVLAVFSETEDAAPVVGKSCMVPNSVTDLPRIYFKLIGKKGNRILTTNEVHVRQGL